MSIRKVTDKILADAAAQARKVADRHDQEAASILARAETQANELRPQSATEAARSAEQEQKKARAAARLARKRTVLLEKQRLIREVFKAAEEKILVRSDYGSILARLIAAHRAGPDDEVMVSAADHKRLAGVLKNVKLTGPAPIKGGVVVRSGRIERNVSLEATIQLLHDDLVVEIARLLF